MRDILIAGAGRSGTSVVAASLAGAGYWMGGRLYRGRRANPDGFFESARINRLNSDLIQVSGSTLALPPRKRGEGLVPWQQSWLIAKDPQEELVADRRQRWRLRRVVRRSPFCLKDPRFSYTADCWLRERPDAVVVAVYREPGRTVDSTLREIREASYLADVEADADHVARVWSSMYRSLLRMHDTGTAVLFFNSEDLASSAGRRRLEEFTEAPVGSVYERSYQRARSSTVGRELQDVYEQLEERASRA